MPYKSDAQRRFMHARHPDIAARWDAEIRAGRKKKKVSKSVLTAKRREKIKTKNFAYPGSKSYPIHDRAHARNALARAAQDQTKGSYEHVARAVHAKYPDIGKVSKAAADWMNISEHERRARDSRRTRARGSTAVQAGLTGAATTALAHEVTGAKPTISEQTRNAARAIKASGPRTKAAGPIRAGKTLGHALGKNPYGTAIIGSAALAAGGLGAMGAARANEKRHDVAIGRLRKKAALRTTTSKAAPLRAVSMASHKPGLTSISQVHGYRNNPFYHPRVTRTHTDISNTTNKVVSEIKTHKPGKLTKLGKGTVATAAGGAIGLDAYTAKKRREKRSPAVKSYWGIDHGEEISKLGPMSAVAGAKKVGTAVGSAASKLKPVTAPKPVTGVLRPVGTVASRTGTKAAAAPAPMAARAGFAAGTTARKTVNAGRAVAGGVRFGAAGLSTKAKIGVGAGTTGALAAPFVAYNSGKRKYG